MSLTLPPWPPAGGLTTIVCPLNQSVFTVYASTHIDAPAAVIWEVLRNTTAYPEWNTFVPRNDITSQPATQDPHGPEDPDSFLRLGTEFTLTVALNPDTPAITTQSEEIVTDFSTPAHPSAYVPSDILKNSGSFFPDLKKVYRIAWKAAGAIVQTGLSAERFNEIIVLGKGRGGGQGKGSGGGQGKGKGCEYRTWENQCGPPAVLVKALFGEALQRDFGIFARDLKEESERKWGSGKT